MLSTVDEEKKIKKIVKGRRLVEGVYAQEHVLKKGSHSAEREMLRRCSRTRQQTTSVTRPITDATQR